jgi:hypothetical protein
MSKIRNGKVLKCMACTKDFYVPQYRLLTAKFCSLECQNHNQYDKYVYSCTNCKKEVITSPSRRNYKKKFCSMECSRFNALTAIERRKKQKAITKLSRSATSSRSLRKNIFRVKEAKCEICNYQEYDFCIDLHHIDNNPNNNTLENIAFLCVICHRKLHKGIINLNNNKES